MKKTVILTMACAALCLTFALPALHAEDAPADGVQMDNMDGGDNNLVVAFNHSTHADVGCEECHHTGEMTNCSGAGCHDLFDKADKTTASYYFILHSNNAARSTCISCHKGLELDRDRLKELKGCRKSACHPE
ncbi:MAG: cytochrome C [Desulfovibrio sp.]|nr:MAG: cytochrome C [Desulfovibrio sp.]